MRTTPMCLCVAMLVGIVPPASEADPVRNAFQDTAAANGSARAAATPSGAAEFQSVARSVLSEELEKPGPAYTSRLLTQISERTGLTEETLRHDLVALLDTLEAQRRARTTAWRAVTDLGGESTRPEQVDKLMAELIGRLRKALGGTATYQLGLLVEQSASKARMPSYLARDLVLRALRSGQSGTTTDLYGLPEKVGMLVEGRSSYRIELEGFEGLLLTAEDQLNLTKVRDIHKPIAALLAEVLPESEHVKWALTGSHPNLQPDCSLLFRIDEFYSEIVYGRDHPAFPLVYATIHLQLEQVATGAYVHQAQLEFTYDSWLEEDDEVRNLRLLDTFFRKAATEIAGEVDRYLSPE